MTEDGVRAGHEDSRAWHDAETGLFGPRAWTAILEAESARCARYHRRATVVIVDLTGFAELESVWGAAVTPPGLRDIGSILHAGVRPSDYVARIGSRRFGVLLSETDEIAAVNFVERVRDRCVAVAREVAADAGCTFGWADATRDRLLTAAAELAIERLSLDEGSS